MENEVVINASVWTSEESCDRAVGFSRVLWNFWWEAIIRMHTIRTPDVFKAGGVMLHEKNVSPKETVCADLAENHELNGSVGNKL